jgi:FtsP/CotA-like multicopper oxidase with cupredoxin domain
MRQKTNAQHGVSGGRQMISRRAFFKLTAATGVGLAVQWRIGSGAVQRVYAQIPGGDLDPGSVSKYQLPLIIPPAMPSGGRSKTRGGKNPDYYEIAVRQFSQRILPEPWPATTVWSYGSALHPATFNYPAFTIEAKWNRPVRVKWINDLVDPISGDYLPHLLPVDQTLHWANPPGGTAGRDTRPTFTSTPGPYAGPVPLVTHLHGAVGVGDESDGYAEAWYLPKLRSGQIPGDWAKVGTWYDFFKGKFMSKFGEAWEEGSATFQYVNKQRASTLWYHDHTLGMTRLNVYAGPAGFYIIRGGPDDAVGGNLPGPAPGVDQNPTDPTGIFEIPIVIQDRSFNQDGSLFYPDTRAFFDEIVGPFIPDGEFSPIWQPEFFGNMMVVNGRTWPYLSVEQRRYRFRFLNGCQSRFLLLDFGSIPGVEVWQIGNEGGFLAEPVNITANHGNLLLMGLAERADVIVDFTNVPLGSHVLGNLGPDEPYGGGVPGVDFEPAHSDSTGQVMEFRVISATGPDPSTPPASLTLPRIQPLLAETTTRKLALIEAMGEGVDEFGNPVEGPVEALLGNLDAGNNAVPALWMDPVTENPNVGDTEVWEMYNTTGDAHPMHVHEVVFEVINRQGLLLDENDEVVQPIQLDGEPRPPEAWETGFKDTVIAYPGEVTRIKAKFDTPGQFVWHCHIVEHEDNEMMRPFRIGPVQEGQPGP